MAIIFHSSLKEPERGPGKVSQLRSSDYPIRKNIKIKIYKET